MTNSENAKGTLASDLFLPLGAEPAGAAKLLAPGAPTAIAFEGLDCDPRPTTITESREFYRLIDTQVAAQLKITYLGNASASVERKMKVFMREYCKYSDCELPNGRGTVRYGAAWRATVLIDEEDAKADVNFPMVAASATLRNHSVQVYISTVGFDPVDRQGIDEVGHKAMEATKGGLNVSTFSQFAGLMEGAIGMAIKAKVASPLTRIGFEPRQLPELNQSIAEAFAIACAAEGRSADDAVAAFAVRNAGTELAIREVFKRLTAQDSDPRVVRLKAQRLIEGVQIPIRRWYQVWK